MTTIINKHLIRYAKLGNRRLVLINENPIPHVMKYNMMSGMWEFAEGSLLLYKIKKLEREISDFVLQAEENEQVMATNSSLAF